MIRRRVLVLASLMVSLVGGSAEAQDGFRVGIGRADITPKEPVWMAGYGGRKKPSQGADHPLHVKALALHAGKAPPLLLITADIIGYNRQLAEEIATRIEKSSSVPRERIMLVASHTHTGPVIGGNLRGMFDLKPEEWAAIERYARLLVEQSIAAAEQALAKAEPAQISFGRSRASFAINRRVFRSTGVQFGSNPDAPVDHEVPVLRIDDAQGKVKAIVFGYACHCTTLGPDHYQINGDWAGYAQDFLERANPGATAFFVTGCGGDANPEPRGKLEYAPRHGLEIAGAVSGVVTGPRTPIVGDTAAAFTRVDLPLAPTPTADDFRKRLDDKNVYIRKHARHHLDLLEKGQTLAQSQPCPVQAWRLGDLTLVAIGGEVVVDYALRLKRELKGNVWMAGYANDVFAYVPSTRILLEGGYEADFNLIYYNLPGRFANTVEDVLVKHVHEVVRQTR